MLEFQQFDVKSGKYLQTYSPEVDAEVPWVKPVEHSYLEHWLNKHELATSAQLYTANFYDGVTDRDRQRLEAQGRILVFTNGKKGYFADPETANLMVYGDADRGIEAIYAVNPDTAHNRVAYGSLVSSDGLASTVQSDVRILVIDDETQDAGEPILNWEGQPLETTDIQQIMAKMGDGTMLVSFDLMQNLRSDSEIIANANLNDTVTQFRAASPDFPGIAKGTAGVSAWCEYLDVAAIVAKNDIKGDDGRFSTPGIKTLSEFWVNRKSDGQYGTQSVGPQVKGTLPIATLAEFNPAMQAKGEVLAAIASDPLALAQAYIRSKERQITQSATTDETLEEGTIQPPPNPIATLLKADPHGLLVGMARINRPLEQFLRNQRVDLAINGIEVPSAMAQHHGALKPWEIANKDLPQGAIVAYYRSPFANISSAAIAVNNHRALRWADAEAHAKTGVAYLNPWTAKHVAVTDFDRDANGYFVGFMPTDGDAQGIGSRIADDLREQLSDMASRPLAEQYEAGRAAIAQLIEQHYANPDTSRLQPAQYPLAVAEIIAKNAPEQKPPDIIKAPKVKHDWQVDQESPSAATWRAWEITANNPTGRVANAAMNLRSFAMETQYVPDDQAEALLGTIAQHYQGVMQASRAGELHIPTDQALAARGYPAYGFADRIQAIADAPEQIQCVADPMERLAHTRDQLGEVQRLLADLVDGPVAENLQTAVDVAKSQRGIDEDVYQLSRSMAYKVHELRTHRQAPDIYLDGKLMPTNTQEPIGWGVEQANALYVDSQLQRNLHQTYYALLPNSGTPTQQTDALAIAQRFGAMRRQATAASQIDKQARANQQPRFTLTSHTGNQFTVQRPIDAPDQAQSPVWDAQDGPQPDWRITLEPNPKIDPKWHPEPLKAYLQVGDASRRCELGAVTQMGGTDNAGAPIDLVKMVHAKGGQLTMQSPHFVMHPPALEQLPATDGYIKARAYLHAAVADLSPTERLNYAGAMWHSAAANAAAIEAFQPELIAALEAQQLPRFKLTGLQHHLDPATFDPTTRLQVIFAPVLAMEQEPKLAGQSQTIHQEKMQIYRLDGGESVTHIGSIDNRTLRLPTGTIATATIALRDPDKRSFELNGQTIFVSKVEQSAAKHRQFGSDPVALHLQRGHDGGYDVHLTGGEPHQQLGRIAPASAKKYGLKSPTIDLTTVVRDDQQSGNSLVGMLQIEAVMPERDLDLARAIQANIHAAPPTHPAQQHPVLEPIGDRPFNPSRSDLREWFTAVATTSSQGNANPQLQEIAKVGKILNIAYCQEQHLPLPVDRAEVTTPMHYWHPNVTLTTAQNQSRLAALAQPQVERSGIGAIEH